MSRKSRRRRRQPPPELDCLSIDQFCERHGISRPHYYRLRAQGLTPDEIQLGTRVLIAKEAAEVWRRRSSRPRKRSNPATAIPAAI
jgi:predicted DNA-binding transcriptional regulator AlpA